MISETQAQIRNNTVTDLWSWISKSDATATKACNAIGSSNCQSNLIIPVNEVWRAAQSISACLLSEG